MKTIKNLWSYLAEFFLEWEMFQKKNLSQYVTNLMHKIFLQ